VFADVEKMRSKGMMKRSEIQRDKKITAKEFDEKFDNGEDISEYLDFSKARRARKLSEAFPPSIAPFLIKSLNTRI